MESSFGSNSIVQSPHFRNSVSPINAQREVNPFIGDANFRSPRKQSFDLENLDPALTRYYRSGSPKPPLAGNVVVLNPAAESPNYLQMIAHQYLRGNSSKSGGSSPFGSRGSSPLSSVENMGIPSPISSPLFNTPVKGVEEGVLVMDGVLVGPGSGGVGPGSGGRARSSSTGSSSSSGINNFYKSCEDSGGSNSSSKCQFSHGKEEMRALRFPSKNNKSEAQACKSYTGPASSSSYAAKCRHQIIPSASPTELARTPAPMRKYQTSPKPGNPSEWCPMDDGIDFALPCASTKDTPGKEAVNAYMLGVLYGPSCTNRLPVFVGICSE